MITSYWETNLSLLNRLPEPSRLEDVEDDYVDGQLEAVGGVYETLSPRPKHHELPVRSRLGREQHWTERSGQEAIPADLKS